MTGIRFFVLGFAVVFAAGAFADPSAPQCLAYGRDLPVNNDQILHWKRTTANQFQERGHVLGDVIQALPDHSGHEHFIAQIGNRPEDTIEVIYNHDFGAVPPITVGMKVEACGDFIVSTAQSGPYPPSPAGAIIHWVHVSPRPANHPSGYLVLNGVLYGQDAGNAGLRH